MKSLVLISTLLLALPTWANVIYLVGPKSVTVKNEVGTSCLAGQNGAAADLGAPHIRFPATIANPQRATFIPTALKVVIFAKGEIQTCEFKGDALASLGFASFGVPYGYQSTTACEVSCGDLKIAPGAKLFASLEIHGYFKLPLDENKTAFQETSFEIINPVNP